MSYVTISSISSSVYFSFDIKKAVWSGSEAFFRVENLQAAPEDHFTTVEDGLKQH